MIAARSKHNYAVVFYKEKTTATARLFTAYRAVIPKAISSFGLSINRYNQRRITMASQPSKFPKDEWARPGSNGTDSTPGTIGFIGIQCAEGVFVLPDMVLKALRDMGIFQQIPNKASMGQALAAKGCLKTDHGNQYTKKINTVVTRGWMITKGLFTDKYHRDIPAAPEYE